MDDGAMTLPWAEACTCPFGRTAARSPRRAHSAVLIAFRDGGAADFDLTTVGRLLIASSP